MLDSVIVRYGEIFLKSEFVRRQFVDALIAGIRGTLAREGYRPRIVLKRHRIYLKTDGAREVAERVSRVFGVSSTSPAEESGASIKELGDVSLAHAQDKITEDGSFAVRAHATGAHSYSSKDIEVEVGGRIQEATRAKVDLTNPDTILYIEVYGERSFVFTEKCPGVGGLPYGTQGRILGLITGKRSMLASWMMMRRGCMVLPVYPAFDETAGLLHKTLAYFASGDLEYLTHTFGNPEELMTLALQKRCLGVVSDLPPTALTAQKLPHYTPLTGLTDEDVAARLTFLRSCVKY